MLKAAFPATVATVLAVGYGLIQAELTAPLPEKPSIRLRVWTGELPNADLNKVLAETQAEVDALKAARDQAAAAKAAHEKVSEASLQLYRQLEAHIAEKQATEWTAPALPSPTR